MEPRGDSEKTITELRNGRSSREFREFSIKELQNIKVMVESYQNRFLFLAFVFSDEEKLFSISARIQGENEGNKYC